MSELFANAIREWTAPNGEPMLLLAPEISAVCEELELEGNLEPTMQAVMSRCRDYSEGRREVSTQLAALIGKFEYWQRKAGYVQPSLEEGARR